MFYTEADYKKEGLYTVTIITKEAFDRKKAKGGLPSDENIGYHFSPTTKEKADAKKAEYNKKGKYKGEKITKILVQKNSKWGTN